MIDGPPPCAEPACELTESGRRLGWVRRAWQRRKQGAFPPGAVTFHLEAWGRRGLTPALAAQAHDLSTTLALEPIWIVHGCAFLVRGEAAVLVGPPGLGKSRVLFDLERRGEGRCVDDGLVIVGLGNGRLRVIETGTLPFARRGFHISLTLRRALFIDRSVFSKPAPLQTRLDRLTKWALALVPDLAFKLNVLLPPGRNPAHDPSAIPVSRIVVAAHRDDPYPSFRLDDGRSFRAVRDLRAEFAPYGCVEQISPFGSRAEVARRIRETLLARPGR